MPKQIPKVSIVSLGLSTLNGQGESQRNKQKEARVVM